MFRVGEAGDRAQEAAFGAVWRWMETNRGGWCTDRNGEETGRLRERGEDKGM